MKTATASEPARATASPARPFFRAENEHAAHDAPEVAAQRPAFFRAVAGAVTGNGGSPAIQAKCAECEAEDKEQQAEQDGPESVEVQRMPAFEGGDDGDRVQRKPMFEANGSEPQASSAGFFPPVQPKLEVGSPDDPLEREADTAAERVVRGDSVAQPIGAAPDAPVRRMCASCAAELDGEPEDAVQRVATDGAADRAYVPPALESRLQSRSGSGAPLSPSVRNELEPRFRADFGNVRLHTDGEARQLSHQLGARAFTHGSDIYFGGGAFDSGSESGKRLLAHELTHTIQQGASPSRPAVVQRLPCPPSNPPAEQPAEDQEEPEQEEQPAEVEARPGQDVQERQQEAPDPEEFAPEPEDDIAAEADEAVPAWDEEAAEAEAATGGAEGTGEDGAEGDLASQTVAVRSAAGGRGAARLNPEGLGEAASPEVVAERDANTASHEGATALLDEITAQVGIAAAAGAHFADLPADRVAHQSKSERLAYLTRKGRADAVATSFVARAAARVSELVSRGQQVSEQVGARDGKQRAALEAAIQNKRNRTQAEMGALRSAAYAKAEQATAQVRARHDESLVRIRARTAIARIELELADQLARQQVERDKAAQLASVERLYADADVQYRAVGPRVGAVAEQRANAIAAAYEGRKTGRKDGFWDGYLTDNRWQARADAARETGQQYKEGLGEEADKQADAALEGKPRDVETIEISATATLEALDAAKSSALRALDEGELQSIEQAERTRQRLLTSIAESRDSTLASLDEQEASQMQFLQDYGVRQNLAIERDSLSATTSLLTGVADAAGRLLTVLGAIQAQIASMEAPQVEELTAVIEGLAAQFDGAVAQADAQVGTSAELTERGLDEGAEQATQALETYSESALNNARAAANAFTASIDTLVQGAMQGYAQLVQGHETTVQGTLESARTTFTDATTGLQQTYSTFTDNLRTRFTQAVQQLEQGLIGVLDQDLERVICEQAEKAAEEVQPWWKSALKILLVIVVIVVVALVLGPAVIGAVGAAAGALGASAGAASVIGAVVGGAIVGGLAGGVIQMGNNVIDGKDLMDGVGKAVIVGAIGGALGGAGGALAQGLANAGRLGAAGLMQGSMKFGIEAAFDVAGGILGDLAVGNPITLEGVLVGAAIGGAVSIGMANVGRLGRLGTAVEGIQTRSMAVGERIGGQAGRLRGGVRVGADADVPTTRAGAVEAEPAAPRTTEEAAAPRAGEEPGAPRADEPTAPRPDERGGPAGKEMDPQAERVAGPEPSESGHDVNVLEDGTIVRCSQFCTRLENRYAVELANPKNADLAARFDEVNAMPPGRAKAKAARDLEAQLATVRETSETPPFRRWDDPALTKEEFRADYAERNPNSTLSRADLERYYDEGFRVNPETGALKLPVEPSIAEPRPQLPPPGSDADVRWRNYEAGGTKLPCFPSGTLVKTPSGDRPIETFEVGGTVFAMDPTTGEAVAGTVAGTSVNWTNFLVEVGVAGEIIQATGNHPFWVEEEGGYCRADQLKPGQILRLVGGGTADVVSIERRPAQTTTYNLEIDSFHTYFVGAKGVLVHNEDVGSESTSKFADTQVRTARLYVLRDSTGKVIYVGETFQPLEARYRQHLTDPSSSVFQYLRDNGYPELATNPRALAEADLGRLLNVSNPTPPTGLKMTPFELAVWEQYYIDRHGGVAELQNKINAITPEKIAEYRNLHNPCG